MKTISVTIPEYNRSVENTVLMIVLIIIGQICLTLFLVHPVFNFIANLILQLFFWIVIVDYAMGQGFDRGVHKVISDFENMVMKLNEHSHSCKEKEPEIRSASLADWIMKVPHEFREAFMNNVLASGHDLNSPSLLGNDIGTVLASSFNWSKSPEGYLYWENVSRLVDPESIS